MRILYLTFYFEPDLCAGSFRNSPLAKRLGEKIGDSGEVGVITTMPNRYSTYSSSADPFESRGRLNIIRIQIPTHKSGFLDQILSFRKYYQETLKLVKNNSYDLVFASSSRLFTAYLGYKIASKKQLPLYLDIRDIFTENLSEIIKNQPLKSVLLPILRRIEKKTFNYARHINLVSPGFLDYFKKFGATKFTFFTNGIDECFIDVKATNAHKVSGPKTITYAGNIGEGQGLDQIVPEAATMLGNDYVFKIVGDGGSKEHLVKEVQRLGLKNVVIQEPIERSGLVQLYRSTDFLFLHLNNYKAFELVLPSKIFEYGAMGKPIVAGVKGFAASFLKDNLPDTLLFSPGNAEEMVSKVRNYTGLPVSRSDFINKFSRENIISEMAGTILESI